MTKTISKTVTLTFNSIKSHSIRYDAKDEDAKQVVTALYIGREAFEGSGGYPPEVVLTVKA